MKYELVPKDVLDEACLALNNAYDFIKDVETKLFVDRAYRNLQTNRTQCNVRPEDGT